jgi:hypothetical protein
MAVVHGVPTRAWGAEAAARPAGWHAWWQSQGPVVPLGAPIPAWPAETTETAFAADIELDLLEASHLGLQEILALQLGRSGDRRISDWLARPRPSKPPVRSADPYRDVRAGLRRAALAGEPYAPRPEVPPRLLAEMAFEEAELLALRLPDSAVGLFDRAIRAFDAAGDMLGKAMAWIEYSHLTGRHSRYSAAQLAAMDTAIHARALRAAEDPGPWRYWTQGLQAVTGTVPASSSATHPQPPTTEDSALRPGVIPDLPPPPARWPVIAGLVLAAFLLSAGAGAYILVEHPFGNLSGNPTTPISKVASEGTAPPPPTRSATAFPTPTATRTGTPGAGAVSPTASPAITRPEASSGGEASSAPVILLVSILTVLSGAAAGLNMRWLRRRYRLARFRGLGTLPLSQLVFDATVDLAVGGQDSGSSGETAEAAANLCVGTHSPGAARRGYHMRFTLTPAGDITTWGNRPPEARRRWWKEGPDAINALLRGATVAGAVGIRWERVLTEGLGRHAAGRIEWVRIADNAPKPFSAHLSTRVAIVGVPAWRSYLARTYEYLVDANAELGDQSLVRIRHVIGRAVATVAGPRVDEAVGNLLGPEHLMAGSPSLVILQAEPSDHWPGNASVQPASPGGGFGSAGASAAATRTGTVEDLPEKLALAADLVAAGTPAVLVLPALPTDDAITRVFREHAARPGALNPRALRRDLRQILKNRTPPAALDDLILLVNPLSYSEDPGELWLPACLTC